MTDEQYAERLLAEYPGLFKEGAEVWDIPTGWYKLIWDWCKEALVIIEKHGLTVRVENIYGESSYLRNEEASLIVGLTEYMDPSNLVCLACGCNGGNAARYCAQCGCPLSEVPGIKAFSAALKKLEAESLKTCEKCGREGKPHLDDWSYDGSVLCADHHVAKEHMDYLGDRIKAWQASGKSVDAWVEEQLKPYWTPDD